MTQSQMNLSQLVNYLANVLLLSQTADYVAKCTDEISEINGTKMINRAFVKNFFVKSGDSLWRDIDSNVTTYIP
jgi:hypothetical protein